MLVLIAQGAKEAREAMQYQFDLQERQQGSKYEIGFGFTLHIGLFSLLNISPEALIE